MANARPDRPISFEGGATEDEDDDSHVDKSSPKEESLNKQNGVPPIRNVDRYGFMGGDQYTSPDEIPKVTLDIIRKREVKWVEMFENWEKWMTKRFKRVRARCRKGIPPSLRARAWQYLCGSKFLMEQNEGKFEEYLHKAGDPKWIEDIHKDLHRQFPLHEIFALRGGHGQEDLFRILKAYTIHNPQDGYCQAQGPIAAVLLMHMPAEQAFWCLVSICEKYLPGYYSPGLEAVHIDGDVLFGLLKKSSPLIYKHMKKQKIEPILYMTEWFMCIFSRTLPWTAVLRVWDMFFCEGVKVMFRIALVLFKLTLGTPEKLAECPTLYETMEKLRHIPHELIEGEFISKESLKLNVDEKDMEKEHQYQITKRRNMREKVQSSEKTESRGSKKKKKEKQLTNDQKEKKKNADSSNNSHPHLTLWKIEDKKRKDSHKKNAATTMASKLTEENGQTPIQATSSISTDLSENPKKSSKVKIPEMEVAKKLAEEAFTAKIQQTLKPMVPDAATSLSIETIPSDSDSLMRSPSSSSSSETKLKLMTQAGDKQLSSSISNENKPLETRPLEGRTISHKGSLLGSAEHPTEEQNKLPASVEQPASVQVLKPKSQMHFNNAHAPIPVQQSYSSDKKVEMHQVDLAANLEQGELLTCPKPHKHLSAENPSNLLEAVQGVNKNNLSDNPMTGSITNNSQTNVSEFVASKDDLSSCDDAIEPESLFVNPLLIEPGEIESQSSVQESILNKNALNGISHFKEKRDDFVDNAEPNLNLAKEEEVPPSQKSSMALKNDFPGIKSQQQSAFEEQIPTNQSNTAAFHLVNMQLMLQSNNSSINNEIKAQNFGHETQRFTADTLVGEPCKILHCKNENQKPCLSIGQQIEPCTTSTKIQGEPQILVSSTLQMDSILIPFESDETFSGAIAAYKDSSAPVKPEKIESDLMRTQPQLQLEDVQSINLKQQSLSLIKPLPSKTSPLNLELQTGNEEMLSAADSGENHCSVVGCEEKGGGEANVKTDIVEDQTLNIPEFINNERTSITEQLVQQLSWQAVQLSNKDVTSTTTLTPPGPTTAIGFSPKCDPLQMKETNI